MLIQCLRKFAVMGEVGGDPVKVTSPVKFLQISEALFMGKVVGPLIFAAGGDNSLSDSRQHCRCDSDIME